MDEKIAPYQALRRSKQDEIARRVQIHQSKISRASARMKAAKPAVPSPLAMLAHGDSWFDYPLSGNTPILGTSDIVEHLQNMGSPNPFILNLSQWETQQRPKCRGPNSRKSSHNYKMRRTGSAESQMRS